MFTLGGVFYMDVLLYGLDGHMIRTEHMHFGTHARIT